VTFKLGIKSPVSTNAKLSALKFYTTEKLLCSVDRIAGSCWRLATDTFYAADSRRSVILLSKPLQCYLNFKWLLTS